MTVRIGGRGGPRVPWLGGFGTLRAPVHDARRAPAREPAPDPAPHPVDAADALAPSFDAMPDGVLPIRPSPVPPSAPAVEPSPAGETMGGFGSRDIGAGAAAGFGGSVDVARGGEGPRPGGPSIEVVDGINAPHPPLARVDSPDARPSASTPQRGDAGARRETEIEVRTAPTQPASIEPMGAAPAAAFGRDPSAGFDPSRGGADHPSAVGGMDGVGTGGTMDAGASPIRSTPSTVAGDGIIRRAMDEAASAAPSVMGSGADGELPRPASTASETPVGPGTDAPAPRAPRSFAEPRSLEELQVRVEQMGALAADARAAAERAGTAVRPPDAGPARFPWLDEADGDEDDDPVLRFFRARDRAHEAAPSAEPAQGRHVHIGSVHVTVAAPAPSAAPPPAAPAPAPYADPWAGYPRIFD